MSPTVKPASRASARIADWRSRTEAAAVELTDVTFGYDAWLTLAAGALGCAPLAPMIRRWTVAIDALIIAGLMLFMASVLFTWRGVRMMTAPVIRFWRGTPGSARRS